MMFNKQGRAISESMRFKAFSDFVKNNPKKESIKISYRGQVISGRSGKWFLDCHPSVFSSKNKAMIAVDKMLAIRAEMALAL